MIRVVMFDLGDTLVDAELRPFPHVREALLAIGGFRTADGAALASCVVSDFGTVEPPITAAKLRPVMSDYLATLERTGLRDLFEPVERRVTLSAHAGALKPDRRVFETALRRLQRPTVLDGCLLVTENAAHVRAVEDDLGMHALLFRTEASGRVSFDDWSQAPAMVARLVAGADDNVVAAARAYLAARDVEADDVTVDGGASTVRVTGRCWRPVAVPGAPELDGVRVSLPVRGELGRGAHGELLGTVEEPSDDDLAEAANLVRSLAAHHEIEGRARAPGRAPTHSIETDTAGRRRLVRKRFTAV